jgi:serine/threonine-protein kinase RsbW
MLGSIQNMTFEVRVAEEQGPDACIAVISGDVDTAVVPELKESLEAALDGGCRNVVLDLSRVTYADSSALSLLVWLDKRLRPLDGRMVLAGANRDVTRILELSGLVQVAASVTTSPNVSAALEGLELAEETEEPEWRERVSMPSRVDALSEARERVCVLISRLGLGEAALFDIKVALGEALANAVRHGSPADREAEVDVDVEAFPDRVVIKVIDCGCGFDGRHICGDDVYAAGGRGIMFMRALMDKVQFSPSDMGGTTVTLVKHRGGIGPE